MSLSPQTISIVKETAPIVAANKDEITSLFYKKMFENNPGVRNVFQMSHQANSSDPVGTQPRALANAVVAYALNIENLAALGPAVELIAQKHVSVSVQPEHYPIVGKHLLEAVAEVIGPDIVAGAIHDAWLEAYNFLANIFIGREAEISEEKGSCEGGWVGWRDMKIAKKVKETDLHTSFYLSPTDSEKLVKFIPGQYIALKLTGIEAVHEIHGSYDEHNRNYSLTGCSNQDMYKITVRRIDDGIVSTHLHDNTEEGDIIQVSVPCGSFVLPEGGDPVVLVGAGVGITPLVTMMQGAVQQNRKVTFIYRTNNPQIFPLKEEIEDLLGEAGDDAKGFVYFTNPPEEADSASKLVQMDNNKGFTTESFEEIIPDKEALFYICGPPGFIKTAITNLVKLGISEERLKYEFFGPMQ